MKLQTLAVLAESEIDEIHEATIEILATCGVKIGSPQMFSFLQEQGLPADTEAQVVRFPRSSIEDALATVPPAFTITRSSSGPMAWSWATLRPKTRKRHRRL